MPFHFPDALDSTMLATYKACPYKFFLQYCCHWKPRGESVHLIAGGAFARGLEVARKSFYADGLSESDSIAAGIDALVTKYGDFVPAFDTPKTCERMMGALEYYFSIWPLSDDIAPPLRLESGGYAIEFSFALPFHNFTHPETGNPLLYSGRADLIGHFAGANYVIDEKTTSQLGSSWGKQWENRCFSADTELLTPEGWVRVDSLTKQMQIAQYTKENRVEFTGLLDYITTKFKGNLLHLTGRAIDQLVTPNHRILLEGRRGGFFVNEAADLVNADGQARIPVAGFCEEEKLPVAVQCYLAAIQADATLRTSKGAATGGRGHREWMKNRAAQVWFSKPRKKARFEALLRELGVQFTVQADGAYYISGDEPIQEIVDKVLDENKIFRAEFASLFGQEFLQELRHWDGWENQYYTQHKGNAEFVQTVAALNNMRASIRLKTGRGENYVVCLSPAKGQELSSVTINEVPFDGNVYCVTVPSGFVLTRRNNIISVSGNSQFTAYVWAARTFGVEVAGAIVRGVSILKTKYDTAQVVTQRPAWEVERWEQTTCQLIERMLDAWSKYQSGLDPQLAFPLNLDHACGEYAGCSLLTVCKSRDPQTWLETQFEQRVWDPLVHSEISVAEYDTRFSR